MDMSRYLDLFVSETREHLVGMNECIVGLERNPADRDSIDSLFRFAHSIKGMAASMGYDDISRLAHAMEDLMDGVRKGDFLFSATIADLLLEGADRIAEMLLDAEKGGSGGGDITGITHRLKSCVSGEDVGSPPMAKPPGPGGAAAGEVSDEPAEMHQTVRVKAETLDNLVNITGELITAKHRLTMIGREMESSGLNDALAELSKLIRGLHSEVMKVRLMPFAALADRFPRAVRDAAKKCGKEVAFEVRGRNLEIDRGILEELAVPLVHLLRNAVDHGLEAPEDRIAAGKPETGKVLMEVQRDKDLVVVTVRDDGRGMDPARLIESAVERGLVKPEQKNDISDSQAFMLACMPGFSTARELTEVSGRGVGMDVVKRSVQSLGGNLSIDSRLGGGTCITIKVPLSVAIIHVLLVNCASMTVGFPVARIRRTLDLRRETLSGEEPGVFCLDGEEVPLVGLDRLLGVAGEWNMGEYVPTIVTELEGRRVGLAVDSFEGQQEVFLKHLGRPLEALKGVAGGAVLGDGRAILVLDTAELPLP